MSHRYIVDIHHAAIDPATIFDDSWNWPIPQNHYDDLTRELIEWFDQLHLEFANDQDALIAFQLIKPDLIKELSCFACALIEVSVMHRSRSQLVYESSETLFEMIDNDQYTDYSVIRFMRTQRTASLNTSIRTWAAGFKRRVGRRSASKVTTVNALALNLNPIGRQIASESTLAFQFVMPDLMRARSRQSQIPAIFDILTDKILQKLRSLLTVIDTNLSTNAQAYVRRTIKLHFTNAWSDFSIKSQISGLDANSTLITGTGGNYAARVVSQQFWREGANVIRTSHGGDTPLFKEWVWPNIEVPFTSSLIMFGNNSAEAVRGQIAARSESTLPMYPKSIEAAGSDAHAAIWNRSPAPAGAENIKSVTVVAASFMGILRAVPHKKLHDIVYYEWHRRLLRELSKANYSVLSKRHPKGLFAGQNIFGDTGAVELLRAPMAQVEQSTDAYVIDFPGTALLEALCTKKPVVLIDLPIKMMTGVARTSLGKAAQIVQARFDERNRVIIDYDELEEALNVPVNMAAREKFVQDFLLSPTPGMVQIQDELTRHG
jgi:hypothetical protein